MRDFLVYPLLNKVSHLFIYFSLRVALGRRKVLIILLYVFINLHSNVLILKML
jgi:hypothetical protein